MPRHRATALAGLVPMGEPRGRRTRVSMTGVTGWFWANPWIQVGMVSMGTKALLG